MGELTVAVHAAFVDAVDCDHNHAEDANGSEARTARQKRFFLEDALKNKCYK